MRALGLASLVFILATSAARSGDDAGPGNADFSSGNSAQQRPWWALWAVPMAGRQITGARRRRDHVPQRGFFD